MKKVAKNISGTPPFSTGSLRHYSLLPSDNSLLAKYSRQDALRRKIGLSSPPPNKELLPHYEYKALPAFPKSTVNPNDLVIKRQAPLSGTALQITFPVVSLQTSNSEIRARVHYTEIGKEYTSEEKCAPVIFSVNKDLSGFSWNKALHFSDGVLATTAQIPFPDSMITNSFNLDGLVNRPDPIPYKNGSLPDLRQTTEEVNYCSPESKSKNIFKHKNKPKPQSNKHLVLTYK